MTSLLYFAYGSNMMTSRMQKRIASANFYAVGRLTGWKVVCNKRSKDGSAKANLAKQEDAITWGVVYEIDTEDLAQLDKFERGYGRVIVSVDLAQDTTISAITYISEDIAVRPIAKDEYKALIVAGAKEHHLPAEYIEQLIQLPAEK